MKDGSRGVICVAIRSRKLGIVIKLEDGWSDEYQGIIVARILEQLQYDDKELIEQLKKTYNTKIYNDCKDEVGHAEADFDIHIEQSYFDELFGNAEPEEDDSMNLMQALQTKAPIPKIPILILQSKTKTWKNLKMMKIPTKPTNRPVKKTASKIPIL